MVQLSSCTFFADTLDAAPLPDLTIKFRNKVPPQGPQATQYSVQFNFLSRPIWAQFTFIMTGPTDIPANALTYGVDVMPCDTSFYGAEYVVKQTANYGNVFPDTKVDPKLFNDGEVYAALSMAGGVVVMELHKTLDDSLVWKSNPFTYTPDQLPYVCTVEALGKYSADIANFTAFDAEVDVMSKSVIQARIGPGAGVTFGTYDDGTNGKAPLFWANESGELSNLWTNVEGQADSSLALELSLTEGNQTVNNPVIGPLPPPPPAPTPLAISVAQVEGSLPVWSIVGLKPGNFLVKEESVVPDGLDPNERKAYEWADFFVYTAAGSKDSRAFRVGFLPVGTTINLSVTDSSGKTASTSFVLRPYS